MEGAFDFILKPTGSDAHTNRQQLKDSLHEKIEAFRESSGRRKRVTKTADRRATDEPVLVPKAACRAVIIGTSTGGPRALKDLLPKLPDDLPAPLFIVQHMPSRYTSSLARRLNSVCKMTVVEAEDKMEATTGMAIVAPGGRQMKLDQVGSRLVVRINDDPSEHGVKPSADYLIRSAVTSLQGNALAIIMTGMGRDGLAGCRELKQAGGYVFAQSQEDCTVYGMPKAVCDAGLADRILTLQQLETAITRHLRRNGN